MMPAARSFTLTNSRGARSSFNPGAVLLVFFSSVAKVAADQNIQISSGAGLLPDSISCSFNVKTDAKGGFTFDKVPPGKMCVTRYVFSPFSFDGTGCATKTQQQTVEVKSGETTQVTLGGRGVCVKGKLVLETIRADAVLELAAQNLRLASEKPDPESLPNGYGFFCQPDGSFIIEDVLPGAYMLEAQVEAVENRNQIQAYLTAFRVGERTVEVVIPEGQGEFDLGNIVVPVKSDPLPASDR